MSLELWKHQDREGKWHDVDVASEEFMPLSHVLWHFDACAKSEPVVTMIAKDAGVYIVNTREMVDHYRKRKQPVKMFDQCWDQNTDRQFRHGWFSKGVFE